MIEEQAQRIGKRKLNSLILTTHALRKGKHSDAQIDRDSITE